MPVAARDAGPAKRRQAPPPAPPAAAGPAKRRQAPPPAAADARRSSAAGAGDARRSSAAGAGGARRSSAAGAGDARRSPAPAARRSSGQTGARSSQARSAPARSSPAKRRPPAGTVRPIRAAVPVGAGIAWAIALVGAVALSSFVTAVLLGAVAAVATASGLRAAERRTRSRGRRARSRPASSRVSAALVLAVAAAVLDPLAALAGPFLAVAAVVVSSGVVGAFVLASGYAASARPLRAVGARMVAAVGPAVAAASVVVARHQGRNLALALVAAVLLYDLGAFVMGSSRTPLGGPVGVASGVASVAVVAIFVAAVMNPPFSGARPWVAFGFVALLAPLGVRLGQLVGDERLPAVRRVDSWLLAAPVWVVLAALLLHR